MRRIPLGPVMVDLRSSVLEQSEREMLAHPLAGGVILFARNFESCAQLRELTAAIREVRAPAPLVAVDQEGGRVQRFRQGFTAIPPMQRLGDLGLRDRAAAQAAARAIGCIIATELLAHGVDFSFAPVLDVNFGASSVIGDRALARDPEVIGDLAQALVAGMDGSGAAAVGKHFPGHGHVRADSHVDVPVDDRAWSEIDSVDLVPYRRLIPAGLSGIMPAHVIYPKIDAKPAGYSNVWLGRILRGALGFGGMIFSDDLSMEGASVAGDIVARGESALAAGCDMVLVCNAPENAARLLDGLKGAALDAARAERMRGRPGAAGSRDYAAALETLGGFLR